MNSDQLSMEQLIAKLQKTNPAVTTKELAEKLDMPEKYIETVVSRLSKEHVQVDWKAYSSDSHFYKFMALLYEMKQQVRDIPFIDGDKIIVRMNDSWAFIFNLSGECVP